MPTRRAPPLPGTGHARVPARALAISVAAFAAPAFASLAFPDVTSTGVGTLVWLPALIPAFLLAYYRGSRGVAVALAGGMAVITATQVSIAIFEIAEPNWSLMAGIVLSYLAVSVGIAVLAEAFRDDRRTAEDLALVDRLTGLANRRHLDATLETAVAAAERGRRLAIALFDLDHFKRVNDVHGHAKGDEALQAFAAVLRARTRRQDLSARFGGEEFVTVLHDADETDAVVFADRVREQMKAIGFAWGEQTVSAGVAAYEPGMATHELLLAAADRALYASKHGGRDRVSTATSIGAIEALVRAADPAPVPTADAPPRALLWIVDDEADIRTTLRLALTGEGYAVWDSDDPKEAVRRYATLAPAERPDAIVTDVIMPGMTGMSMIDHIASVAPGLRVVYMSGYVKGPVTWSAAPGTVVRFLEKPFTLHALAEAVEGVLAAPVPAAPAPSA